MNKTATPTVQALGLFSGRLSVGVRTGNFLPVRKLLLGVLLLAVAAFGVLYIGAVQAQASAASFCNSLNRSVDSYGFSVNENAGENTVVGTLAACGDPHRTPLTYSVGGTDAAAFNEVFALDTNQRRDRREIGRFCRLRKQKILLADCHRD